MKKFYTLALATVVAFSASALDLKQAPLRQSAPAKAMKSELRMVTSMKKVAEKNSKLIQAPVTEDKAVSATDLEGLWVFSMGDYYFQTSVGSTDIEYIATVQDNLVIFESASELPFIGTFDAANNQISFPREYLGPNGSYHVYQNPYYWDYDLSDLIDVDALIGDYDPELQELTFNPDHGLAWEAYSDADGFDLLGYFSIYDFEGAFQGTLPEPEPIEEEMAGMWTSVGMATLVDAWIVPSYSMGGEQLNPADYAWQVELQQYNEDPNIYRLWKPYTTENFPLLQYNQTPYEGQIVLDLADPDNVVVMAAGLPGGFKNSNGEFYMMNALGFYIASPNAGLGANYFVDKDEYEAAKELVIEVIFDPSEPDAETPDTFKNNVVTINKNMFDFNNAYESGYSWKTNPYQTLITFPDESSIELINADNNNAPVEYFNLQGVRVDNPAAGQLVIKKQGSQVSKLIVR